MGRSKTKHFEKFDNDKNFCFTPENFFQENKNFLEQNKKILLEIGTGKGKFFSNLVKKNLDLFCVGCDLRKDRLINARQKTEILNPDAKNFSFVGGDAKIFLEKCGDESIEKIYMNFPDACTDKKSWKLRFFQQETIELVYKKLKSGGKIFIKTDDFEYFYFTRVSFFFKKNLFREISHSKDVYAEQDVESDDYICTEFEEKWIAQGKKIFELVFEKK